MHDRGLLSSEISTSGPEVLATNTTADKANWLINRSSEQKFLGDKGRGLPALSKPKHVGRLNKCVQE